MTHNQLSHTLDKIAYDTISQTQPAAIADIRRLLAVGGSARMLEAKLHRKYGRNSTAIALLIGAAYYIENQKAA